MLLVRDELRRSASPGKHALSIGVFDGVHKGHQALLSRMLSEAESRGISGGVITFHPHPVTVIRPEIQFSYLTSLEKRVELIRQTGADFVSVLSFSSELQQVSAKDFCEMLVQEAGLEVLVVGNDFRTGRNGEGDIEKLKELGEQLGFEVIHLELIENEDVKVSSTRIRAALAEGEMEQVQSLMGHTYSLRGPILLGDQRGRTIGFPTINVGVSADRTLPPDGVYATMTKLLGNNFPSITNIGSRPTFEVGKSRHVETHILDFDQDVYDEVATVEFLSRLRDEQKFQSPDELINQIQADVENVRKYFSSRKFLSGESDG